MTTVHQSSERVVDFAKLSLNSAVASWDDIYFY